MIKKRSYLTIFVIFQVIFLSSTIVISELDKELTIKQKNDTEYYWFSICIMIGSFDEKSIDDSSYISKYVLNHTDGIVFGLLRDNGDPNKKTPMFLTMENMTVRIISINNPARATIGYIGDNFLCVISRDCTIR